MKRKAGTQEQGNQVGFIENRNSKEVDRFFSQFSGSAYPPRGTIVVIEGPPGSGKSETLKYLAAKYQLRIEFWNGFEMREMDAKIQSVNQRLIRKGIQFGGVRSEESPHVLVIELLPIPATLRQEQDLLKLMRKLEKQTLTSLVFILTHIRPEKYLGNNRDPDVNYNHVKFKSLPKTTIKKVINCEITKQGLSYTSSQVEDLSEKWNGDLNSAMAAMGLANHTVSNKRIKVGSLVKDYELDIFHALGKICYNKRMVNQKPTRLPEMCRETRSPLYFDVFKLIHEIGSELFVFEQMLFENYIDFFADIDDVAEGLETFSLTDSIKDEEESLVLSAKSLLDSQLHSEKMDGLFQFRSPVHIYRLRNVKQKQEKILEEARSQDQTSFMPVADYWLDIGVWSINK